MTIGITGCEMFCMGSEECWRELRRMDFGKPETDGRSWWSE
jgi:hypothetical protein